MVQLRAEMELEAIGKAVSEVQWRLKNDESRELTGMEVLAEFPEDVAEIAHMILEDM